MKQEPISCRADNALAARCQSFAARWACVLKRPIFYLAAYIDNKWKKIGVVKALPLPMTCTLTQLSPGNKNHFLVRATDVNGRQGECSEACTITLK